MRVCALLVCVASLLLCVAASSDSPLYAASSVVFQWTRDAFTQIREKDNHLFMVQYYTPDARNVRVLEKEWTDAAKSLQGFMPLAVVNCQTESVLCAEQGVTGSPIEVKFYKAGDENSGKPTGQTYTQAKEAKAFVAFALLNLRNPSTLLDNSNYAEQRALAQSRGPLSLFLFSDKKSTPSIYKALATSVQADFACFEVRVNGVAAVDRIVSDFSGVSAFPSLWLTVPEGNKIKYEGEWNDILAIKKWINVYALAATRKQNPSAREYVYKTPSIFPSSSSSPSAAPLRAPTPPPTQAQQDAATAEATTLPSVVEQPPPIVGAPRPAPEQVASPTIQIVPPPAAPINAAGDVSATDIEMLRKHPHVDFPDLNDEAQRLPQLADNSCLESFCNNPEIDEADRKQCVLLVLYPSQIDAETAKKNKILMRQVDKMREKKMYTFVWVDGDAQSDYLQDSFHVFSSAQPQIVLLNAVRHKFIRFVMGVSEGEVNRWLDAAYENRVQWSELPQTTPGPSASGYVYAEMTKNTILCPRIDRPFINAEKLATSAQIEELNKRPARLTDEGQMIYLSSANFDSYVTRSKQPWILLFCNGLEQVCKDYLSAYLSSARVLRNQVQFGYIDAQQESDLAQLYNVHTLPSVRYWDQHAASKSVASVKTYHGPTDRRLAESSLVTHATGLLDAQLVRQVFSHNLAEWMGSAARDASSDAFVIRVLLFHFESTVPTYMQALSYRWRHVIYFGITLHTDTALLTRFSVSKIPSLYMFKVPRDLSDAEKNDVNNMKFEATPYEGVLSYNHLNDYLEQLYEILKQKDSNKDEL